MTFSRLQLILSTIRQWTH